MDRVRRFFDESIERRRSGIRRRVSDADEGGRARRAEADRRHSREVPRTNTRIFSDDIRAERERLRETRQSLEANPSLTAEEQSIEHILGLLGVDPSTEAGDARGGSLRSSLDLPPPSASTSSRRSRPLPLSHIIPRFPLISSTQAPLDFSGTNPNRSSASNTLRSRLGRRFSRRRDGVDESSLDRELNPFWFPRGVLLGMPGRSGDYLVSYVVH